MREALLRRHSELAPELEQLAIEEKIIVSHLALLNGTEEVEITEIPIASTSEPVTTQLSSTDTPITEVPVKIIENIGSIKLNNTLIYVEENLDPTDFTIGQCIDGMYPLATGELRKRIYWKINTSFKSPRVVRISRGHFALTTMQQAYSKEKVAQGNFRGSGQAFVKMSSETVENILAADTTIVDKLARYASLNGGMLHLALIPKEFGENLSTYISQSPRFTQLARGVYQLTAPIFGMKHVSQSLIDIYETACLVGGTFSPQLIARELKKKPEYADKAEKRLQSSISMICTTHPTVFDHPRRGVYKLKV